MIRRGLPPRRKTYLKRSTKPVRPFNPDRAAKRLKKYRQFMASVAWQKIRQAKIEQAGGRCEMLLSFDGPERRCPETTRLTVHHVTYRRFGGDELMTDLRCLCKTHHDLVESGKPHKQGRRGVAA